MKNMIGWVASAVLLATICSQIYRQWTAGTSKGVSTWLFVGQIAASAGFTWYSILGRDPVFIATNALMLIAGVAGLSIVVLHRRRGRA